MMNSNDLALLARKGISEEKLNAQLNAFSEGFPFLQLAGAASTAKGILSLTETETENYLAAWQHYTGDATHRIVKFVPASGAASRMFKDMFAFADGTNDLPTSSFEKTFFEKLPQAAFYNDLNEACQRLYHYDIPALLAEGRYKDIVRGMLNKDGLNYGALPKGLLKFHSYEDGSRTPLEEHLVEGALYARSEDGTVKVHFTVSPEHRPLFEALVSRVLPTYEEKFGVKYDVSFSEQKSSTDTVAANADNTPFRNADGSLLFRPGGHGALIENLNDIKADVVFVKNIDNVVPDRLKGSTIKYKKLIAGVLVSLQQQIFDYLRLLDSGNYDRARLEEIARFLEEKLSITIPATLDTTDNSTLTAYLYRKLNRPIRVCGMVRNVGEPGGGPFLAYNTDGSISPQILESSQIDMNDPEKKAMFEQGTHFNPVDLVCAIRDYKGESFSLPSFVDPKTGFISHKSKDGKELKALELPGLWNGAMSDWTTIFVEVPLDTFNPVKTVNDLYRDAHK